MLFLSNHFPPKGYIGGAEVSNFHTCRELRRGGIDCSILAINHRYPEAADLWYDYDGIPVHNVALTTSESSPWRDIFDPRIFRLVSRELRRIKPDLVHLANVSGSTLAPFVAARRAGVPVVCTLHDLWLLCPNNMLYRPSGGFCDPTHAPQECERCFRRYDFWGHVPYRRSVFRALTANVRLFVSPSQALIDRHVEAGYSPDRFRLVPYGLREERIPEPSHPAVIRVNESRAMYNTLAFAGGGVETKGAHVLFQAIPLMLRHIERLRVVIAGGGEQRLLDSFRAYAPAVQVLGRIPFEEMRTLFGAVDLSVVPSVWHENSPVVIYENYQAGTPVLGSDFGGIPELIREGQTGYTFPVGDPVGLAEKAILHFARPSYERRRMRQACYRRVSSVLSLRQHIVGMQAVHEEALTDQ